jgi:2-polyprenyl-3-methyl-5-hydroxy-6-metoxy-1,4-benzoquinol methylase
LDERQSIFRSGPLEIRETVYGIAKRLRLFIEVIEDYRQHLDRPMDQVRVLDVGCGTGVNVALPLAEAGYQVVGLDSDSASISHARELASGEAAAHFVVADLERIPTARRFDVVICSEVLEHLDNPEEALSRLGAVIDPPGRLLVTIPNPFGFFEIDSLLWRALNRRPERIQRLYALESRLVMRHGSPSLLARRQAEYLPDRLSNTWSTLAPDQGHAHALGLAALTLPRLKVALQRAGWRTISTRNNTLVAGNIVGLCLRELDALIAFNAWIADYLPSVLASDWIVIAGHVDTNS